MRRTRNIEEVLPILYLKGVSTGDFEEALTALLGDKAKGMSATTICRLKETWQEDYTLWQQRDLSKNAMFICGLMEFISKLAWKASNASLL